jgi:CRISPR-associated protein Cmr3
MSAARFYLVEPQDTVFFRDGRPYEQADDGLAAAASLFPPHPTTLTGALRVALALGNGWDGTTDWDKAPNAMIAILGDGHELSKGTVRFGAPLLMRQVGKVWEPLYPAPRNLLIRKQEQPDAGTKPVVEFGLLRPSRTSALTDLGSLHPMLPPVGWENSKNARPARDLWLTADGLAKVLAGGPLDPDFAKTHTVNAADLWAKEPRIGLEMSAESRTAKRGRLYAPTHVRLRDGVGLGVAVSGLPDHWEKPVSTVPLGGEHRFAHLEPLETPTLVQPPEASNRDSDDKLLVSVTLLSSARVGAEWLKPGPLPDGAGEILSACLGDVLPVGGWNSHGKDRGPRPLQAFLPAGSCWFLRVPADGAARLPSFLGDAADHMHGFGHFALGTYQFHDE